MDGWMDGIACLTQSTFIHARPLKTHLPQPLVDINTTKCIWNHMFNPKYPHSSCKAMKNSTSPTTLVTHKHPMMDGWMESHVHPKYPSCKAMKL
jgi:hypothetical protein